MESLPADLIVYLSMILDLDDLLILCRSSKKINFLVCDSQNFWMQKLLKDFNIKSSDIPKNYDYKNYYQHIISQIRYEPDNLDEVLVDAAVNGDLNLVKIALNPPQKFTKAKPANINTAGYSRSGHFRPNNIGPGEPLRMAAKYDHLDIFKFLIENGADTSINILRLSLFWTSNLEIVKYILQYFPDYGKNGINGINELIKHDILNKRIYIVDYLIKDIIGINNISEEMLKDWLISASGNGIKDKLLYIVEYLIGYNPSKETINEAIAVATKYGNDKTVEYLYNLTKI